MAQGWLALVAAGGLGAHLASAAPGAAESASGDPLNAVWSLIGSSTVAGVLLLWIRSEKADRQQERSDRLAALAARDVLVGKLIDLIEADTENKAQIRERLKGQDDVLGKLLGEQRETSRVLTELSNRRGRREGGA